jgi:hypothetical protein
VQGNDLLYHYFEKTLFSENEELFKEVVRGLVVGLGVWLQPMAYERFPLLVPYAVRDPKCRSDVRQKRPDAWGAPDHRGQFRDDNSLIKGIPKSLVVANSANSLMNGRRIGTGFVAAHVWRKLTDGTDAPRDEMTYSFLPNVVWLPSQVAKLSDREGKYVQTLLQGISLALYRDLLHDSPLARFVEPIWQRLPVRDEARAIDVPLDRLNFFQFDEQWFARRLRSVGIVREALAETARGAPPRDSKVVSSRYGTGLNDLPPDGVLGLLEMLTTYQAAVAAAAP